MNKIEYTDFRYQTKSRTVSKIFPSIIFYLRLFGIIFRASRLAQKHCYKSSDWVESSYQVMQQLEKAGVRFDISGIENVVEASGPVVIVGNHMSMMETLVLPVIIQPIKPVTFVVKDTLLSYPVFKHIMLSRNPVAVTRTNPRQDLKTVLTEGLDRLKKDISIIVFPQTTRSHIFDVTQMSSIGVKLAKKAGVSIIPLALKTDCWQNGKRIKDCGKLDVSKTAYFAFGEPIIVEGKGDAEHAAVNAFIVGKLKEWENETTLK